MSVLLPRTNDALRINPPTGNPNYHLTVSGSDWLWAVTALYFFVLLLVIAQSYFARSGEKIFNYLFIVSLFVGGISYFTIASDLGNTPIGTSTGSDGTRQIFYVKYINWFVGWTPLLIALGLISGVSWATIIYNIALTWIWVASWLSGALVGSTYKWGYFVFGTFSYFLLSASLLQAGSLSAKRLGIHSHYFALSGWLVFIWLLYAIAWGLDDGGNRISVTDSWIFWGILDLVNVPLVAVAVLFLSRRWDYKVLNLYFTQYGRVAQGGEFPEREKAVVQPTAAPADTATPQQVV